MKKIGIVGGVGWPSTIEYYRIICEESQSYHSGKDFSGPIPMPEISIESLNMNFSANNRGTSVQDSWNLWDSYFNSALRRLEKSGAEVVSIASVTPHARLTEISKDIDVKIVSVYEAIGLYCKSIDVENLLVLGTMPTMTSPAFISGMKQFNIKAFFPPLDGQKNEVVEVISELYQNKTNGAEVSIDELVRQCVPKKELINTAVCLGCTELPLAFQEFKVESTFKVKGINYLNSTVVHAKSIFEACIS
jgi:aspartate racemase